MSVTVNPYKRRGKVLAGAWEVNIRVMRPDGVRLRERLRAPTSSRSAALRWGEARERELLFAKQLDEKKEVPTLAEFGPRFLSGYAEANRQKPSGIAAKETVLRVHLVPALGRKRLDEISNENVQQLKARLVTRSPKTVNNVLTVLNTMLRTAVEWKVIDRMPCTVRLLKIAPTHAAFHDFDEYARLVDAARRLGSETYLCVLLGGDAGLRCGEMMALEWTDVDLDKRQLRVQRSDWKGKVTPTKGGRPRCVPMTTRLAAALAAHRHLRGKRVLYQENGEPLTQKVVRNLVMRASRLANLANQNVHILRHSFCSHLAMRGAPTRAIQELAGHADLSTTQRYMHLSPAAIEAAVRLLEGLEANAVPGRHMGGAPRPEC